jgi:hypothetical protein
VLFGPPLQPTHPIPSPGSLVADPKPLLYVTAIVICILAAWALDTLVTGEPLRVLEPEEPGAKLEKAEKVEAKNESDVGGDPYREPAGTAKEVEKPAASPKPESKAESKPRIPHVVFYAAGVAAAIIAIWTIRGH